MSIVAVVPMPAQSRIDSVETISFGPTPAGHPAWCDEATHYTDPDDGAQMCYSPLALVSGAHADKVNESNEVGVQATQLTRPDGIAERVVHVEAPSVDLTPAQALRLAAVLTQHAHLVMGPLRAAEGRDAA